ncbi:HD domain protein [Lentilactobacillus senioris DSM 24302 = JCM 17472]|uniref:HD domain protein n=1 Tax=Lentilactobacillus senioris DSM 24302 = JCM 17472 TaxID=1423802 RepID=A0A0R2CNN5_9LACO|nr:HD domain-containing protein [Lentilactobacillus senioris]KRM93343.1 HD domain protein [Lentilactobacillus senioris DSM 24302 = JCM 17472]
MSENISLIALTVQQQMQADTTGHNFDHIQRVVKNAELILRDLPQANRAIVLAAAYMHDLADDKLVTDLAAKQNEMEKLLATAEFESDQASAVMDIISNMSFSANLVERQTLSLEGQIVQDADRLDAIGAIGITRAIYYSGHFGETVYDPLIAPREKMTKEEYRQPGTTINHFYEKLLKLADQLNTAPAKKIGQHRNQVMLDYLAEFKAEWNGER